MGDAARAARSLGGVMAEGVGSGGGRSRIRAAVTARLWRLGLEVAGGGLPIAVGNIGGEGQWDLRKQT